MARTSGPRQSRPKQVGALRHGDTRLNIPTAEMQSFFQREEDHSPMPPAHYPRNTPLSPGEQRERDPDRDPQLLWNGIRITLTDAQLKALAETGSIEIGDAQLVWRGKDTQDWSDLIVQTPPLYIQEKIHPKAIIDDLKRRADRTAEEEAAQPSLFADFNGVPRDVAAEFYQHDSHWSNRMISGDSLAVMASLAEREHLKGRVQCIYIDPPYGIRFNSNWQVSTRSRDVKDGRQTDISREPEQVKAFRDTWKDGIHSYLTYLRDRLTVARDLLHESGSVFVQIGDENVHRVRAVMDEVFGETNFVSLISFAKTGGQTSEYIPSVFDFILWYGKLRGRTKYRRPYRIKERGGTGSGEYSWVKLPDGTRRRLTRDESNNTGLLPSGSSFFIPDNLTSNRPPGDFPVIYNGITYRPRRGYWKTSVAGMQQLVRAGRTIRQGDTLRYVRYFTDFPCSPISNLWEDTAARGWGEEKVYVVQTGEKVVERCILMTTDPGDLVLDPTCGAGTTAYVAEQWGRRWITIDTSRVALALARTRLMSARYKWYLLTDSPEGRRKEAELTGRPPLDDSLHGPTRNDLRQGFVYDRVPHITLKSIANNSRIDDIHDKWQATLEKLRAALNEAFSRSAPHPPAAAAAGPSLSPQAGRGTETAPRAPSPRERGEGRGEGPPSTIPWQEWEIPREAGAGWPEKARAAHEQWWRARIARQREIDDAIAQAADVELLYDRPYDDPSRIRVAGPFTVESLSPHRIAPSDAGELADDIDAAEGRRGPPHATKAGAPQVDFAQIVIEYLQTSGIHQSDKRDRIVFDSVTPWPGNWIGAEGSFRERDEMRRAAILIGPEYGTVSRPDLIAAAREANEAGFDILIACAFNFDAHSSELDRLGPLRIIKARMNPDLHMAGELKNTGRGNLFVVFGEPDIDIATLDSGELQVTVKGVDVYDPNTGDIRSNDVRDIAAWFIDTDYNEESFFVRHAYFLGANDPYKALKTALRAEIDEDAWASLYSARSRPFPRPRDGVFAVKVINHFGDEVMKVYRGYRPDAVSAR
jgi:adenine-specific DNA-methyltransferase